ncbi:MAG: hypothetical protein RMK29_13700 [Myxococcales bacterium]|nr:hypothetical protein [Myxococcota bacterium]MDW8282763.1 hypothetical protein [Myxococcales bacterium]
MREQPRQTLATQPRPDDLVQEARRLAALLRIGHIEAAQQSIDTLTTHMVAVLGDHARRGGRTAELPEALALLEAISLTQAQGDHVATADVLEHQLAPLLEGLCGGGLPP